jgi:hypothetical protein
LGGPFRCCRAESRAIRVNVHASVSALKLLGIFVVRHAEIIHTQPPGAKEKFLNIEKSFLTALDI